MKGISLYDGTTVVTGKSSFGTQTSVEKNKGSHGVDGMFVGVPQGGPLSPLLSNIMLDELDKELVKREHRFVRYADDCNIYVKTKKAGARVKQSITEFIEKKLKLKVNDQKSAVDRPWKRSPNQGQTENPFPYVKVKTNTNSTSN